MPRVCECLEGNKVMGLVEATHLNVQRTIGFVSRAVQPDPNIEAVATCW